MDGLSFLPAPPPVGSDPARADIACFVGLVARRGGVPAREIGETDEDYLGRVLPDALGTWFRARGWRPGRDGRTAEDLAALRDVPVPVDTWEGFDALFAWDARPVEMGASARRGDATLGAAVRAFFAQGGRKAYVVRLGDPWPVLAPADQRGVDAAATAFLPGFPAPSAADRSSWRGIGHLFGLPDVSFLCLPDLPELFAVTPGRRDAADPPPPSTAEVFVECATRMADPPADRTLRGIPAPRCDADGFRAWAGLVNRIGGFLARSAREVQGVLAIPLPVDATGLAGQPDAARRVRDAAGAQWTQTATIRTAFVQLAYPWLRTAGSDALPGGVEPPDGTLAGLLANGALTRGSWRSALRQPVPGVAALEPVLDRATLGRDLSPAGSRTRRHSPLALRERVSVIGPTPGGFRLLSDVTADEDEAYRPANVNRLLNATLRAARVLGETVVFQHHGEALWAQLRDGLGSLLAGLRAAGALADDPDGGEAFEVLCDRRTMTPADLDAGRVVCRVSFTAAAPLVHLTVVLAMDEGGHVSLASRQANLTAPTQLQVA